jgi:serine protease Do
VIARDLIKVGEDVLLLGPEPVRPRKTGPNNLYVRMGEASGTISNVTQAPSGEVARFRIRSPRLLSVENVGGIAINSTGETVGIVDSVQGTEASILPAALVHRAVKRVLASKASVPKPWLGVKGEAVSALKAEQMQKLGWGFPNASKLAQAHRGILLTWIAPDSPAAFAALRAGDVILKVNDEEIQSAADFSWFLEQAGPTTNVEFTVARPGRATEEEISVKLSAPPSSLFNPNLFAQTSSPRERWLAAQGIETIALRPAVAARLGATSGLLIVFVEPSTPAFQAGLQPGDVIQTINGRPAMLDIVSSAPWSAAPTFEIIRKKMKLVVGLPKPAKK